KFMNDKKILRIGLIGCGFMGRTHSNAYKRVGDFFPELNYRPVLTAVCSRSPEKVKAFAAQWGYGSTETDWKALIARDDIDAVDMLAHCIDTAMWLNGSIKDVSAMTETFIKERVHQASGKVQKVGIDDACIFHCHFENGSLGLFESTRYARGHKALYTLEINGEHASIRWDLHDLNKLEYFDHKDESIVRGWRSIHVSDGDQPYMKHWWVPGLQIGYEHTFVHQFADFVAAADGGKSLPPTFRDGLATDAVTDAVLKSAQTRQWQTVASTRKKNA